MFDIPTNQKKLALDCVIQLEAYYQSKVLQPLERRLKDFLPEEVEAIAGRIKSLKDHVGLAQHKVGHEDLPLLKLSFLLHRREMVEYQRRLLDLTVHHEIQSKIDKILSPLIELLESPLFKEVEAMRLPAVGEYLSLKEIYSLLPEEISNNQRQFDSKFGILNSQSQFNQFLRNVREQALLRNIPVTVAFIDIDGFKSFNEALGEAVVDRLVLPRIMQEIEAHVFPSGTAFLFGGDEYVLLLPNMRADDADDYFDRLQQRIGALKIPALSKNITISIGSVTFKGDYFLEDGEILEKANRALRRAKLEGKDCRVRYFDQDSDKFRVIPRIARRKTNYRIKVPKADDAGLTA